MKLLIVALIRNEAADLSFLGVSQASEGRGFSDANISFSVCMLGPRLIGWCVCMFAYEGRQHTCMLTWFNIHVCCPDLTYILTDVDVVRKQT